MQVKVDLIVLKTLRSLRDSWRDSGDAMLNMAADELEGVMVPIEHHIAPAPFTPSEATATRGLISYVLSADLPEEGYPADAEPQPIQPHECFEDSHEPPGVFRRWCDPCQRLTYNKPEGGCADCGACR